MKLALLLPICLLAFGCASVMNSPETTVRLRSAEPSQVRVGGQTYDIGKQPVNVKVPRSREPLALFFSADSSAQTVEIPTKLSFAYWANIYFNLGLGMLVDKNNVKRFSYPQRLQWNPVEGKIQSGFQDENSKGSLRWKLSFPYVNNFHLNIRDSLRTDLGFLGLATGIEYFYNSKSFISLDGGAATSFLAPVPAPVTYEGPHEHFSATYLRLSHHHVWNRWDVGYGAHFTHSYWYLDYARVENPPPRQSAAVNGLGLVASVNYMWGKCFYTELNYQPTLWTLSNDASKSYQHLLSLEFGWKFRLR